MANPDRVVRNHRFPSLPPVRVHGLASRVPPPATDRTADDREGRYGVRPAPVCTFTGVDGGWNWRAARRRRCPEPTSGRRSGIRRAVWPSRWSRTGAGRRSAVRIVRRAGPVRCPARSGGPTPNGPGASTQAACTRTDGFGGVRGRWESVAEASRQAASGDPVRQGGTAGGPSHAVEPRGQDGTYWRATLRGDMRALPRRAVRSRDRDTTTPIVTASRRPGGSTAWAAAARAAGASSPMSGWRPPPPAAPWACSRWTRTSAGPVKGTAPAGCRVSTGPWSWTRPAPKPGWFPCATGRAIFGSFWPAPGTDRRRSRCGPANPQGAASSRGTGKSGTCGRMSGRPRRWAGGSPGPRNAAAPTGGPGARSG